MRASDDTRERVAQLLGRRCAEGYIGPDTLERRLATAYTTQHRGELEALVADLPAEPDPRRGVRDWSRTVAHRVRTRARRFPPPIRVPAPPREPAGGPYVIGRDPVCDLVVGHPSVSRRHAALVPYHDRWMVRDLGSTNGTRVNGWRVKHAVVVCGDEIALGEQRIVLRA